MPEGKFSLPLIVTIGLAAVPVVASFAVTAYSVTEVKGELRRTEDRLTREIQAVDLNSANRRNESHAEMLRAHQTQAEQIIQLREDFRDLERRTDAR